MGKHVDRQIGGKFEAVKPVNIKIENQKAFKELVEKVGNLELAIQELTENKNNSLATYLLENKETINRLTAKAQHENIVSIYSTFVTKIEYKMGEERVKNFNESAKRNNFAKNIFGIISQDKFSFGEAFKNNFDFITKLSFVSYVIET